MQSHAMRCRHGTCAMRLLTAGCPGSWVRTLASTLTALSLQECTPLKTGQERRGKERRREERGGERRREQEREREERSGAHPAKRRRRPVRRPDWGKPQQSGAPTVHVKRKPSHCSAGRGRASRRLLPRGSPCCVVQRPSPGTRLRTRPLAGQTARCFVPSGAPPGGARLARLYRCSCLCTTDRTLLKAHCITTDTAETVDPWLQCFSETWPDLPSRAKLAHSS